MLLALLASALALAACVPAGGQASTMPERSALAPVRELAPTTRAAASYNEAPQLAASSPLSDEAVAAMSEAARAAGVPPPFADARLGHACEELAKVVPEKGVVAYDVVEFAMQHHGIIEPSPRLLVVWGELDHPREIVDQLRPTFAKMLADAGSARIGIGAVRRRGDGYGAVVFALLASRVSTRPIPRALPAEGRFRIEVTLGPECRKPEVLTTLENGQVRHLELTRGPGEAQLSAELSCIGRRGRQQIEISANVGDDRQVLANFPIWCGEQPPGAIHVPAPEERPPPRTPHDAEQQLFAQINRDRRAAGLAELAWDEPVAAVARLHAAEMRRTQHVIAWPTERLSAAGIKRGLVQWNMARAYGVEEAHAGLMGVPTTREHVISPLATHVGIGVVFGEPVSGRPELFITELITRVNPPVDKQAVASSLYALLTAKRALPRTESLDLLAQQVAEALASGQPHEQVWANAAPQVKALSKTYRRLGSMITALDDASTADPAQLLPAEADELGIGVAQGPHPQLGDGATWVVLLHGLRLAK